MKQQQRYCNNCAERSDTQSYNHFIAALEAWGPLGVALRGKDYMQYRTTVLYYAQYGTVRGNAQVVASHTCAHLTASATL
jgi:hypothetical protein